MKKWLSRHLKLLLVLSLIVSILAGCAEGALTTVKESYPLESASGSGAERSYVYRAAGMSVPEVAEQLIEQRTPQQQSEVSTERMFLVYRDEIVHLQQDPQQPEDTLIEISTQEYVRQNYSPSFLEGYLLASLIHDLFDHGRYSGGQYRGYSSYDTHKPKQTYRTPTADDKKMAPPITVNRTGSIFKRSPDADATVKRSGSTVPPASGSASSTSGKITRDGSGSAASSGSVFTKPKKSKAPKIKMRTGKIGRRR